MIRALPSDRYELKLLSGARGKTTQAVAQYMVPRKGEWCPESCAAFFESEFNLSLVFQKMFMCVSEYAGQSASYPVRMRRDREPPADVS